jgi:hypothetical protein
MSDEPTVMEITDEQIENFVLYQQLQFGRTADGEIEIGVIQVPVPKVLIERFQEQFAGPMAEENLKLVTYRGKLFLAPVKTSSLIGI